MSKKNDLTRLTRVAVLAENYRAAKETLRKEAEARIRAELANLENGLELAVVEALDHGHNVTEVARAYTPPGNTPNRVRIYNIRKKHDGPTIVTEGDFPFRWEPRVIETFTGERTVYDAVGILMEFGPDDVSGTFRWTYIGGELEPVLDPTVDPYPNTKAYTAVLEQWLLRNPYPGEDANE